VIPGSLHAPGLLDALAKSSGRQIVFYCAFGERSARAVQAARESGLASARHLHGEIAAWTKADGAVVKVES